MSLLASVHETLVEAGIGHAVIGATAMASYGVSRSTLDTDLLTVQTVCLLDECWAELQRNEVHVRIVRGDRDRPLAGVVRLRKEGEKPIDIVVGKHAWQGEVIHRAEVLPVEKVPLDEMPDHGQKLWQQFFKRLGKE